MKIRSLLARHIPAIVLAAITAILAVGGIAYATSGDGGTIRVCVHKKGGGLYQARRCKKHDKRLSWNARGRRGRRGFTGAQGNPGPAGAKGSAGARGSTGATGARGATGPTGGRGPVGPSAAFFHFGPANQAVTSTDQATPTVMTTINVGAGSYVITANGSAKGTGTGVAPVKSTITCGVGNNNADQSGSLTLAPNDQGTISVTQPVATTTATTYRFNCYLSSGNGMTLVSAQLTAVQVGGITNEG